MDHPHDDIVELLAVLAAIAIAWLALTHLVTLPRTWPARCAASTRPACSAPSAFLVLVLGARRDAT